MLQKRIVPIFGLILFGLGFPLFVQAAPDAFIFFQPISGAGGSPDERTTITKMITNEIIGQNCTLLDTPRGTDFILFGALSPYYEGYEDLYLMNTSPATTIYSYNATMKDASYTSEQLYVFFTILRDTNTNENLVQQSLIYSSIDEVYNFFPLMMYNLFTQMLGTYTIVVEGGDGEGGDNSWRDRWLYIRLAYEVPFNFYVLQPDGLIGGSGAYAGDPNDPSWTSSGRVAPLDNKTVALPLAGTVGLEFQFLNWMSVEPIFQLGMDTMNDQNFFYMAAGLEVKAPLKFSNILLEPYGAVSFPLSQYLIPESKEIFSSYPLFGYGGGVQLDIKVGDRGIATFVDVNYMYFGDVGVKNPYGEHFPNPAVIHYQRSVLGLGIGVKAGFIDRKKTAEKKAAKEKK